MLRVFILLAAAGGYTLQWCESLTTTLTCPTPTPIEVSSAVLPGCLFAELRIKCEGQNVADVVNISKH